MALFTTDLEDFMDVIAVIDSPSEPRHPDHSDGPDINTAVGHRYGDVGIMFSDDPEPWWFTPEEARRVGKALIDAADAANATAKES